MHVHQQARRSMQQQAMPTLDFEAHHARAATLRQGAADVHRSCQGAQRRGGRQALRRCGRQQGVQGQGQSVLVVVVMIAVTAALAELLARVDGCYLNKTDRQRRKNCCWVCLGRRIVFGWLKMIHCLSCSSNSNCTGSQSGMGEPKELVVARLHQLMLPGGGRASRRHIK